MREWVNWLRAAEKKRISWLEKRLKEITEEIRHLRINATQRMARDKRKRGETKDR